jgi:hypothetical protein
MTCRVRECHHRQLIACAACFLGLILVSGCGISSPTSSLPPASGSGSAATGAISDGAQLGLAWSSGDATLRPVVGVPGSAQFGASLVPAGSYVNAAYSTQDQSALIVDKSGNLYLLTLSASQPSLLTQGIPAGATMIFAPLGGYALVYAPGASSATLIGGLPKQPIATQIQARAAIQAAAVSDAGTSLLATGSASGVAITAITAAGTRSTVATLGGYGGMAFLSGSEDVLLADSASNTLARLHNGALRTLATTKDGLNQPLAVAASLDSHWAVTANHGNGTLVRIDLTAATPAVQSTCTCSPTSLLPLAGNAVFELTAPGTAAAWIIEADDLVPRVLFIPPVKQG